MCWAMRFLRLVGYGSCGTGVAVWRPKTMVDSDCNDVHRELAVENA